MDQPFGVDRTGIPLTQSTQHNDVTGPLISAKLAVPALPPAYRARQRLLTMLDNAARYRLTAITGPAGSGKTTLAASWAAGAGPVAWLTLDGADNEPAVFWSYLR